MDKGIFFCFNPGIRPSTNCWGTHVANKKTFFLVSNFASLSFFLMQSHLVFVLPDSAGELTCRLKHLSYDVGLVFRGHRFVGKNRVICVQGGVGFPCEGLLGNCESKSLTKTILQHGLLGPLTWHSAAELYWFHFYGNPKVKMGMLPNTHMLRIKEKR